MYWMQMIHLYQWLNLNMGLLEQLPALDLELVIEIDWI